MKKKTPQKKLPRKKHTSDGHGQGASLLVGGEGDIVEEKGNDSVDKKGQDQTDTHLGVAKLDHRIELALHPGKDHGLDKGQRRHAQEKIERVELETADLDAVGDDGLDGGKGSAEEGEKESHGGVGIVTDGGHVDSQEQRHQ